MKTIHWGMIGCGDVTERKSGPGLYKARNSTLYGVTNRHIEKAVDYAKRHQIPKVYESVDEMLADPVIDAVYIATPPNTHKEFAVRCAAAKKTCYIEKPLALNYQECLEIRQAFAETDTKAFIAFYRRALPRYQKLKELLAQSVIGDIRFLHLASYGPATQADKNGSWRVNTAVSGGGLFMDVGVHQLDVLDYVFGPIAEFKAVSGNQAHYYQPEDIVNACFSFESGVQGSAVWCFTAGCRSDQLEIIGSAGMIRLNCMGNGSIFLHVGDTVQEIACETPEHIQQNLIQSIVDELNGIGTCPSTLESALRTAKICDIVYNPE